MAKFRIWYRAAEIAPARFMAVVACVPDGDRDAVPAIHSECRVFADRGAAHRSCVAMAAALSRRVTDGGDEITGTEAV